MNKKNNGGSLFLFAADQKIEHLNEDFSGKNICSECADPEHLFKIAKKLPSKKGSLTSAFATQLGLISHYGCDYKNVNYIVKLNSKTNLVTTKQRDPISLAMYSVDDVVQFKKDSGLSIVGVAYTIYLGSEFEHKMFFEAAQIIYHARKNGLLSILWIYPRGKAVKNELDADLIAGAAGVAACLGADFVKINQPSGGAEELKKVVTAAGRTGVLCAGGEKMDEEKFLQKLHDQIFVGGTSGFAIGRNIFKKPLGEAVELCNKIAGIILGE